MVSITAASLVGAQVAALLPRTYASVIAALALVLGAFSTYLVFMLVI